MGTSTSPTLPSVTLWRGLQCRARPVPALLCRALVESSASAQHRASIALLQLAALASLLPALRLAHYCRECDKLLSLALGQPERHASSRSVLLRAAVRLAALMQFDCPQAAMHLYDSASLDELRRARGKRALSQRGETSCPIAQNSPRLRKIIDQRLASNRCLLGVQDSVALRSNSEEEFAILHRVGALEAGKVLLDRIDADGGLAQSSLQRLRLELYCRIRNALAPVPTSLEAMRLVLLELALEGLLRSLGRQIVEFTQRDSLSTSVSLERCLHFFHRVAASLNFMSVQNAQAVGSIVLHGQALAAHLRCWPLQDREGRMLLCLCLLALERQLLALYGTNSAEGLKARATNRLARRVAHYIRLHRRRLRNEYYVRGVCLTQIAGAELEVVHVLLSRAVHRHRPLGVFALEDEIFHCIVRLKGVALYLGEVALYEILWGIRELASIAIERQLVLSQSLLRVLLRASAYGLRCSRAKPDESVQNGRLLHKLNEALRVQREIFLLGLTVRNERVLLHPAERKARSSLRVATGQLPMFLAQNIQVLTAEPEQIYACQNVQEFAHHSGRYLLELNFLTTGARALQVYRVAALSEVMAEVYRALHSVTVLPPQPLLRQSLQAAHCCLREALNQAAARQSVQDVRPIILRLYHFLEGLHEPLAAAESPSSRDQRALTAINALAADLRAFGDVFASLAGKSNSSRLRLASTQLQELRSATRQLQEDLAGRGQVHIGRLRGPLLHLVGRLSNERGKQVRLVFVDEDVQAPRELVQSLQLALESLLVLLIDNSVERPAQRRAQGKRDTASIHIRASQTERALGMWIEDDGEGLPEALLESIQGSWSQIGGEVSLEPKSERGCRVRVHLPLASARWDIATKPL